MADKNEDWINGALWALQDQGNAITVDLIDKVREHAPAIEHNAPADTPVRLAEPGLEVVLRAEEDVRLVWPEGTLVQDRDGDFYEYHEDHWTLVQWSTRKERRPAWEVSYDHDSGDALKSCLPAQVVDFLPTYDDDATPKVGDYVRVRADAKGGNGEGHPYCVGLDGTLAAYSDSELYWVPGHTGPLSDFEKIGE